MEANEKYFRQLAFANPKAFEGRVITVVGAGGIGSPTVLALAKMGDFVLQVYDDDAVSAHNQPSTLYGPAHVDQFKGEALAQIVYMLTGNQLRGILSKVPLEDGAVPVSEIMIMATDNMKSRKLVWDAFYNALEARCLIDARMGGEGAQVYTIVKQVVIGKLSIKPEDVAFYESMMFPDAESDQRPCSARAIIYNTFMIAALVARSVKAYCVGEVFPREVLLDCKELTLMVTE